MKKMFICLFITFMAVPCFGQDSAGRKASAIATQTLVHYYSAMVKLKTDPMTDHTDFHARLEYLNKNRKRISSQIYQDQAYRRLESTLQLFETLYHQHSKGLAYTPDTNLAREDAYFDTVTGHRYIKQNDQTYAEYTRKGEFLKTVASDMPLLLDRRHVIPVSGNNFILYEKYVGGKTAYLSLPGHETHPEGWKACKILTALN